MNNEAVSLGIQLNIERMFIMEQLEELSVSYVKEDEIKLHISKVKALKERLDSNKETYDKLVQTICRK